MVLVGDSTIAEHVENRAACSSDCFWLDRLKPLLSRSTVISNLMQPADVL